MSKSTRVALLSVSDKTGLIPLAQALVGLGFELLSTGGTAKALRQAGVPITDVAAVTGFPEIMEGRVKTLHPKIHGGLLAKRDNADHKAAQQAHDIADIELLVCNLYPFEATLQRGATVDEIIENIDVGGPAMIRAAAKNHAHVTVIVSPEDYAPVLGELKNKGQTSLQLRQTLAMNAFARTSAYDAAISHWFHQQLKPEVAPRYFTITGQQATPLRYGENPHQWAALYPTAENGPGIPQAHQVQGKALSYNNISDADAALSCLQEFTAGEGGACVIVKHANPCGVALGDDCRNAYARALACDPVSAFGGIIAFNKTLDGATARDISKLFTEMIIAPAADAEALSILALKPNLRLLLLKGLEQRPNSALQMKSIAGGVLVQSADHQLFDEAHLTVPTRKKPDERQMADLAFAFRLAKHVKSNAVIFAKDGASLGIGAGQMSRVDAARIAIRKAGDAGLPLQGSVAASDAFFPFPDGLQQLAEAGATAIIQPGGSLKDAEVIAAADQAGIAMVLTGMRHFKH